MHRNTISQTSIIWLMIQFLSCFLANANTANTENPVKLAVPGQKLDFQERVNEYLKERVIISTERLSESMTTRVNFRTEKKPLKVLRVDPPEVGYRLVEAKPIVNQTRGNANRVQIEKRQIGDSYELAVTLIEPDGIEKDVHVEVQLIGIYVATEELSKRKAQSDMIVLPVAKELRSADDASQTQKPVTHDLPVLPIVPPTIPSMMTSHHLFLGGAVIFLAILIILDIWGKTPSAPGRALLVFLLATCLAAGLAPLIHEAILNGTFPWIDDKNPVSIATSGALASWIIVVIIGWFTYIRPKGD
ncbi:MAG: hypothetical protein EOO01_12720 [Chitinophagaceae bacterium]|nr:MAG: hypothetical protein EOO01_12720 [Chitinophagaceae bacterium]